MMPAVKLCDLIAEWRQELTLFYNCIEQIDINSIDDDDERNYYIDSYIVSIPQNIKCLNRVTKKTKHMLKRIDLNYNTISFKDLNDISTIMIIHMTQMYHIVNGIVNLCRFSQTRTTFHSKIDIQNGADTYQYMLIAMNEMNDIVTHKINNCCVCPSEIRTHKRTFFVS